MDQNRTYCFKKCFLILCILKKCRKARSSFTKQFVLVILLIKSHFCAVLILRKLIILYNVIFYILQTAKKLCLCSFSVHCSLNGYAHWYSTACILEIINSWNYIVYHLNIIPAIFYKIIALYIMVTAKLIHALFRDYNPTWLLLLNFNVSQFPIAQF